MDVMAVKNKKIKKLRLITSFLIITLSIILLVYAIISDEPIVIIVVLILVVKIIDLIFNFYKIRRKKLRYQF
jgi:uncharacterized membrane protein